MSNTTTNTVPVGGSGRSKAPGEPPTKSSVYAMSLALVVVTFVLRGLVAPTLGNQALYLFLVPPVLVAGVLGGIGPGLFATTLSLSLHLYTTGEFSNLVSTDSPLFAAELWRAAIFTVLGLAIALFGERLYSRRELPTLIALNDLISLKAKGEERLIHALDESNSAFIQLRWRTLCPRSEESSLSLERCSLSGPLRRSTLPSAFREPAWSTKKRRN